MEIQEENNNIIQEQNKNQQKQDSEVKSSHKINSLQELESYHEKQQQNSGKKRVLNSGSAVSLNESAQNLDSKNAQKRSKKQQLKQRQKELQKMDPEELKRLQEQCKYRHDGSCDIENCLGEHEDCPQYSHQQKCSKLENNQGCLKFHRKICQDYRRGKCAKKEECPLVHKDCKKINCNCIFYHVNTPSKDYKVYNISYSMIEKQQYKGYIEQFEFLCKNCDQYCLRAYLACGHDEICRVCVDKERAKDLYVNKCNVCQQTISENTYVI